METGNVLQLQRAAPFSLAIMTKFMFSFSYLLYRDSWASWTL